MSTGEEQVRVQSRTLALVALVLLACTGCTMHVDPAVGGPYKRYPRGARIDRECLIQVDAPERRSFDALFLEFVVPVRTAVERAAKTAFGQHFTSTRVVRDSGYGTHLSPSRGVSARLSVENLYLDAGATTFNNDVFTIVVEAAFDNGRGAALTHRVTGKGVQMASKRGERQSTNLLFGLAIIDAMDQFNAFIAERRPYFSGGR
ncbi:MAG: hypothetical protein ACYS1C_08150 [Planctomycetota bacterium]|jgi:hypothetical protein